MPRRQESSTRAEPVEAPTRAEPVEAQHSDLRAEPVEAEQPVDAVDLSPVLDADPLDLRVSLASIVHWADSHELRIRLMQEVDFPVDDLSMFLTVNQLSYRGAMRPTDLALILGTGKANVSKIARRLENAGLLVRVPATDDERSVLLALTPSGREIGERIMSRAQATLDASLAGWSPAEIQMLRRMLAHLAGLTSDRP
jgi:DNA-binding MarR family transcriptional regulator